jgi:hypothetical protein
VEAFIQKRKAQTSIQSNLNYTYRNRQHPGTSFKRSESYLLVDGSAGIEKAIYEALRKENKSGIFFRQKEDSK